MRYLSWQKLLLASSLLVWIFVLLAFLKRASERVDISKHPELLRRSLSDIWVTIRNGKNSSKTFTRESPLLFITGTPRSGVNLLRILLDAHRSVRCAPESGYPMHVVGYRAVIQKSPIEMERLASAGVSTEIMDIAFADFLLQIFARQGDPTDLLCVAEHTVADNYGYMEIFYPNAKFIHVIRDGRAVANSFVHRKIDMRNEGYMTEEHGQNLDVWHKTEERLLKHCVHAGPDKCLPIYYELLVARPEKWLRKILDFLNVTWDDNVLRHHALIAQQSIKLTKYEENREGLSQPINATYSWAWVNRVPADFRETAFTKAPTLKLLGYNHALVHSNFIDYLAMEKHISDIERAWSMTLE